MSFGFGIPNILMCVDCVGEPVEVSSGMLPFVSGLKVGIGCLPSSVVEGWGFGSINDSNIMSWAL